MNKSVTKNSFIILLAIVNAFLLYIVLHSAGEARHSASLRQTALEKVLSENSILLNPDIEMPNNIPSQVFLEMDNEKVCKMLSVLLGNCETTAEGGNIYHYSGAGGQATFSGTGNFEILLNNGVISTGNAPLSVAKSVLKKLGISYENVDPIVDTDGKKTTVTLFFSRENTIIYNSQIKFLFVDDSLAAISGIRPLEDEYDTNSSGSYIDGVTASMGFLDSVKRSGRVCSRINNIVLVYSLEYTVSGRCTLNPAWCFQTDTGTCYIDAQSGISWWN